MHTMLTPGIRLLFFISFYFYTSFSALYAQAENYSITVPQVIRIESGVESVLPIKIDSAVQIPADAWLLIRGIPETASLTDGRVFPSGTWVIKPSSVNDVRLITPSDSVEFGILNISLVTTGGESLGAVSTQLFVSPDAHSKPAPGETVAAIGTAVESIDPPNALTPRTVITKAESEKIIKIMERADRYLDEGKFEFARRFYQLAAEMGSPEGAEAIARTYDSEYLRRFPIIGGIEPDEAQAQLWYRKAQEMRGQTNNKTLNAAKNIQ